MSQTVISILSNAGGVGKTTLAVHLAYSLAQRGIKVVVLDLDPQKSLDIFCGLRPAEEDATLFHVLSKNFRGDWPLAPAWSGEITVCQGHHRLADMANELVIRTRSEYVLADRLREYPIPCDLVILDCPATQGILNSNALAASTHVLIPVQLELKAIAGASELVRWCFNASIEMYLNPKPQILGLVPSMHDEAIAMHRQYSLQLPSITEELELKLYPRIRKSNEFKNACAYGQPLQRYRPKHPAIHDFKVIVNDLVSLVRKGHVTKN